MKSTTFPQSPDNPSLTVSWDNRDSFTSYSTFAFAWKNNSTTHNWDNFTPILFSDDASKKSTKILEWPNVAVTEKQRCLTLPQITDQEQRVHVELWCSKKDNPKTTIRVLCGKSPQFTLTLPHNHPTSTNVLTTGDPTDTHEATTTYDFPTADVPTDTHEITTTFNVQTTDIFDPYITIPLSTNVNKKMPASSLQSKSLPTTTAVVKQNTTSPKGQGITMTSAKITQTTQTKASPPPKMTVTPPTTKCSVNIPDPSCLPVLPSIIAPNLSHNSPFSSPSSSSSSSSTTTTTANTTLNNSELYPTGAATMNNGAIAVIVIACAVALALGLYLLHVRWQRNREDYDDAERLRGRGGHNDPEAGPRRPSMSSLTPYGRMRSNRITPPWSLTFSSNKEDEKSDGRTYPQVPPVHISHPVLVDDPVLCQNQRHRDRQHQQQYVAALNTATAQNHKAGGPGSSPVSPVSTTSSRYRGAQSTSTRYPATVPGGGVATTALAAHASQQRTLPPASSEPSSPASNESKTPPIHAWSPFPGRISAFRRKLTTTSSHSSSSRSSSIFSELSALSSASSLPINKEEDRRLRQGFKTRLVELPKAAALRQTHINAPIRSIMSISSEEGHILARKDVLIRMEDNDDDYESDSEGNRHEQQQQPWYQLKKAVNRHSIQGRTRDSEDTYHSRHSDHNHSRHLPNQLNSSTSSLSRQGHHHQQHQQPWYNPRRSSLARTSYCPSILPPTPKIPERYISSTDCSLSRGSSVATSLSRPIGYDPEWVDTAEEDDNGSDYGQEDEWRRISHRRRKESMGVGRKGGEISRPISRSMMKAVRRDRRWSRVSPALPKMQASEWDRARERERATSKGSGVAGGHEGQQQHLGVEYY